MLTNSLPTNLGSLLAFDAVIPEPPQARVVLPLDRLPHLNGRRSAVATTAMNLRSAVGVSDLAVRISPPDIVKRRTAAWRGMRAEIVQVTSRERIEFHYRGPLHLLVVCEQGIREDGETVVQGLPRSSQRDLRRKLTFVPAGHEYHEWHEPRLLTRVAYFYFDPATMPVSETGLADFAPRLHFEDRALWDTALKLTTLIESADADCSRYLEALGVVLAHELVRLNPGTPRAQQPRARGGLAAWQQRIVIAYIEEHLSEQISLATLAQLIRLSPFYFCRAFKQSFGVPPHRYHTGCRIERAKEMLAKSSSSVTDIGLTVGFSETSSFTAAFRKATGLTPTAYHRSLG
jgi:AraC family transcriptional regulator